MEPFAQRLQSYYGLSDEAYADLIAPDEGLSFMKDPFTCFKGYKEGLDLIAEHLKKGSRIMVYGDYDVDGMTSTAILVSALRKAGGEVGYFVPSRYKDGYGLNSSTLSLIAQKGYRLLITVDNGISAFEPVKEAKDDGMDVLIVDHHTIEGNLPQADAFIHPEIGGYVPYAISAAFLSFLVSFGLLHVYDPYYACLAGLAVFSDVMPMTGLNRKLARYALNNLLCGLYKNFNYLLNGRKGRLTSSEVNSLINAPLNALGRVDIGCKNNNGVRFLLAESEEDGVKYGDFILHNSKDKKDAYKAALLSLQSQESRGMNISSAVLEEGNIGLLGALASSLCDKEGKPVFVFAPNPSDPSLLTGSARSPEGSDLYAKVAKMSGLFKAFGGHKQALGLTLAKADYPFFIQRMEEECQGLKTEKRKALQISMEEVSLSALKAISALEPFGNGFNEPLLALRLSSSSLRRTKDGKHAQAFLPPSGSLIWFNAPELGMDVPITLVGHLSLDSYQGVSRAKFMADGTLKEEETDLV